MEETARPITICGFLKVRNEIIRDGNLYRVIDNLSRFCDCIVACDDGSTDGTRQYLEHLKETSPGFLRHLLLISPTEHDFSRELEVKQRMLDIIHEHIKPRFIWWADGDELLSASSIDQLPDWLNNVRPHEVGWAFKYTQLWGNLSWARTDAGFDEAPFVKLWRYSPDLSFEVKHGTHHQQFPRQIVEAAQKDGGFTYHVPITPFEVLHLGNAHVNLRWKCIQYHGGLGDVPRHMDYDNATYRYVEPSVYSPLEPEQHPTPVPWTELEKQRILAMGNLKRVEGLFTVVIPTYNRAYTLGMALQSLIEQTYQHWIALVLDDGSTDGTHELMLKWQMRDPRIFYCRYSTNRGGVAMNEIGMAMACEFSEYWTRLGSDDWFFSDKLANDALALQHHPAVYGPFRVIKDGKAEVVANPPMSSNKITRDLAAGRFRVSWANAAIHTSVLDRIRDRYGNFVDPRLSNMEDFLFNYRLTKVSYWAWRCIVDDKFVLNPSAEQIEDMNDSQKLDIDSVWYVNPVGASSNREVTKKDHLLTLDLIRDEEYKLWSGEEH